MWRVDVERALDAWVKIETPPDDLLVIVNTWALRLLEDPYALGHRADGFEALWHAVIPGTHDGTHMVTCSYFIDAVNKVVRCTLFGYQSPPFTW